MVRVNHRVASRSAHIAVGVDMDGIKHVLGIWVQAEEGASFWAHVCAELANRGVSDVLIVCCDGLTGLPEAIEATWPQATVQTCVVHLIRASMRFVSYGDRKKVAAAVKPIYTAPSQEAAWQALTDFSESDLGVKYPQTVTTWERAWERFTPFLDFPPMLRRVIYTTNSIESLNYQLRKVTKNRGHFPSDEAVVKLPKAGDLRHRGQTSPRTRQGERTASIQAQGQGQTRRRTDHHRLEQGPGPAHHRLPRPIRPPPVNRLHRNLDRLSPNSYPRKENSVCSHEPVRFASLQYTIRVLRGCSLSPTCLMRSATAASTARACSRLLQQITTSSA